VRPHREIAARVDGLVVEDDGAGAALAAVAADLGSGQPEAVTQRFGKRPAILDLNLPAGAVDGEADAGLWRRRGRWRRLRVEGREHGGHRGSRRDRRAGSFEKRAAGNLLHGGLNRDSTAVWRW